MLLPFPDDPRRGYVSDMNRSAMLVLAIIAVLLLFGVLPAWPYSSGWGYYPAGGAGLLLIFIVVLLLMGPKR